MSRRDERNEARKILDKIEKSPELYYFIHYSCESFFDTKGSRTPRVCAIAIKSVATGQIESFSIHEYAEILGISSNEIESKYSEIEKVMLDSYFNFLNSHRDMNYIHVNMRDKNFGFRAIEQRYKVLKGKPFEVLDAKKVDFAILLKKLFGYNYIEHPRMENLYKLNNIQAPMFLSGQLEAAAFKAKEYMKLHQSTLAKVEVYCSLLNKVINKQLKTHAKFKDMYGITIQGIIDFCKNTWWIQLIWSIVVLFLGSLLGVVLDKYLLP